MLGGFLMLSGPIVLYLVSMPLSGRLRPTLRNVYRIVGAIIVVGGATISLYFAMYSGDQGGIAAFFFQTFVIAAYGVFVILIVLIQFFLQSSCNE